MKGFIHSQSRKSLTKTRPKRNKNKRYCKQEGRDALFIHVLNVSENGNGNGEKGRGRENLNERIP
jgi:hypothetical protein